MAKWAFRESAYSASCEAVAQIAAQRGQHQTVILDHLQKFPALFAGQLLGRQLAVGGVGLNALRAHVGRQLQGFGNALFKGIENNSDGEIIHFCNALRF